MVRNKDEDPEFSDFVAARSRSLLRTAFLLTGDHQLAEDLVQTALTKTYLAWGRISDKGAAEAYVRRTMLTTHTSWWRRRSNSETPVQLFPDQGYDTSFEHSDERARLWAHLQSLPPRQRAVVVLRFYEDLSAVESAHLLNCSVGTIKSQTSRALSTLRARLATETSPQLAPGGTS